MWTKLETSHFMLYILLLKSTFYANRMSLDSDHCTAVDVIWFCTCKIIRRDVASEVQSRLAEIAIKMINSGNEVHSNEVHKCGSLLIFTQVSLL